MLEASFNFPASSPYIVEARVTQRWISFLLLAAACGGGKPVSQAGPDAAATTPDAAVRSFMQAVADSNITRMGHFWGTGKGPAAVVNQPSDHQQRLTVTQSYLRGSTYRVVRMDPVSNSQDRMTVTVDLDRRNPDGQVCVKQVPFGVIRAGKYGWIVSSIDLNQAGAPARPCGAQPS